MRSYQEFKDTFDDRSKDEYSVRLAQFLLKESFKYYILHENTRLPDTDFDVMCKDLIDLRENLSDKYKELCDIERLKTGSFFDLTLDDYPWLLVAVAFEEAENDKKENQLSRS